MKDSPFWNNTVPKVLSTYAIIVFVLLWAGFALALMVNQDWLDLLWHKVQGLPFLAEITVWVLFLPIMVGLWIWESPWSDLLRVAALAGIAGWTLLAITSFVRAHRAS